MTDCPYCSERLDRHKLIGPGACELGVRAKGERILYESASALPLAVTTATITGREEVFAGFRDRLAAQSAAASEHIWIREEPAWRGEGLDGIATYVHALVRVRNDLLRRADAMGFEWVVTSDDDDLWEPDHLETLWRCHVDNPGARIIYALSTGYHELNGIVPELEAGQTFNPHGSMVNEAMLHVPTILAVGGYIYREGWNEDVLADLYWVQECGIPRVFTDHVTVEWNRGEHPHAIDVIGMEPNVEWQAIRDRQWDKSKTKVSS